MTDAERTRTEERLDALANRIIDKCGALLALDDLVAPRDMKAVTDTLRGVQALIDGGGDGGGGDGTLTVIWRDCPWD